MIELDAHPAAAGQKFLHRLEEVVFVPVGIADVVTVALAIRLPVIEVRADGGVRVRRDHESIVATERAVHVVRVVIDVVD